MRILHWIITSQITALPNIPIPIPKAVKTYTIKKSNTKYNPRSELERGCFSMKL